MNNIHKTFLSIPSPSSRELVAKLRPYTVVKSYPARRKLTLSSEGAHFCFLIVKGRYQLHRQTDNLIVGIGNGPSILGLGNTTNMYIGTYITMLTVCEIGILTSEEALELIDREQLWRTLSDHLFIISGKLFTIYRQLTLPTVYEVVRTQIQEYMCEEITYRESITVEQYIRNKTHISRSAIMKILLSLKSGGYLELERGKIITINSLPKKY